MNSIFNTIDLNTNGWTGIDPQLEMDGIAVASINHIWYKRDTDVRDWPGSLSTNRLRFLSIDEEKWPEVLKRKDLTITLTAANEYGDVAIAKFDNVELIKYLGDRPMMKEYSFNGRFIQDWTQLAYRPDHPDKPKEQI